MTTFISYATEYDLYEGKKDWLELTTEQQDNIIKAELTANSDPESLIMGSGLLKTQAQGLRGLLVYASMILEKSGKINDIDAWDKNQQYHIMKFLQGTVLGKRIAEAFNPPENPNRESVKSKDLELFTGTDYDYVLDLSACEAKSEILEKLEKSSTYILPNNLDQPFSTKTEDTSINDSVGSHVRGMGQVFVSTIKEIAELPDAPLAAQKDWQILKEWLDCGDGPLNQAACRKISLAWQSYLALGVAPSAKLEKDFNAFSQIATKEKWERVILPPEIIFIFERMLATDQEVTEKAYASPEKPSRVHSVVSANASIDVNLKDVRDCLQELFDGPLKAKGLLPTVAQTPDFPYQDYSATLSALRSGKAHLSFGLPNLTAFKAIATNAEKFQHTVGMLAYWLMAPIVLVVGAAISENYWLMLWGILLFPLAFFGTHPHYKKAPLFLMASMTCVFLGISEDSAAFVSVGAFFALAIAGYSFTRRLYNQVLIGRSLEIESALMFLLGCNYLHLCGEKWSLLWTPAWLKDRAKMQNMERQDKEYQEMITKWSNMWSKK